MTPQLFAIFAHLVEEKSGLHYGEADRDLFGDKVEVNARERGYDALLDYYYRLRYDDPAGEELTALLEALLVHETYFFRELAPLVQLADTVIAAAVKKRGTARIWSAACSTGEEPYTIAMLLEDRGILDRVEIIATDISAATIQRAKAGRHGRRSLREGYPADLARRHLEVGPTGVSVSAAIRAAVKFSTLNLKDETAHCALGLFDVIVCRNVLIYFSDSEVSRVVERLSSHLGPDGLLAVGVSESLLRFGTTLACEERGNSFFYRRLG